MIALFQSKTRYREEQRMAYVGSRTTRERNARGEGISVFKVDPSSGGLARVQVVGDLVNPSYLCLDASSSHLYSVHGDIDEISAFSVDSSSGQLTFLNRQRTGGTNPVHLAIDPSGRYMVVSNHAGGSIAVLPIDADGKLGELVQLMMLEGPCGPHRIEQTQAKPHFNGFDPSGHFVIVPDKGLDRIFTFEFSGGRLRPAVRSPVIAREVAGPRHHTFHPRGDVIYVVNELDSTVTCYRYDASSGALDPMQRVSTLPDTCTGDNRASGIMVDAQGKMLYASNRGHDSIAIFRVEADSLRLTFMGSIPSGGRKPRFFTLDPNGTYLYVLNEDDDSIVMFAIDPNTGLLEQRAEPVRCGSPVCMAWR